MIVSFEADKGKMQKMRKVSVTPGLRRFHTVKTQKCGTFRNQEKGGGFSKRLFLQSRASRPGGRQIPRMLGEAVHLALRGCHSQERRTFLQRPPSQDPLFLAPEKCHAEIVESTMGPNMITHTHMFVVWELLSQLHRTSVTQGFLAGMILCNSAPS